MEVIEVIVHRIIFLSCLVLFQGQLLQDIKEVFPDLKKILFVRENVSNR